MALLQPLVSTDTGRYQMDPMRAANSNWSCMGETMTKTVPSPGFHDQQGNMQDYNIMQEYQQDNMRIWH